MKVSIIVPLYNARKTVGRVIEACLSIDYPDIELVVVDDGSTDGSAEIASRYPIKLIRQTNGGPAKARNAGWKASNGEICFFTDSDCLPRSDVLTILLKHLKRENIGAAGGSYDIANPQYLLARLVHSEIATRHRKMPTNVNFLGSFNLAVKRELLEKVGGFNEEYGSASGEDNDLSYRILKRGKKLSFDMCAAVTHFHEISLAKYLKQQYNHGKWRVKLYKDHKDKRKGDDYAGFLDLIQPLLALFLIAGLPSLFFETGRVIYLGILALYTALQIPRPLEIILKTGRPENLLLAPVTFLRGIARGLGLVAGIFRFGF